MMKNCWLGHCCAPWEGGRAALDHAGSAGAGEGCTSASRPASAACPLGWTVSGMSESQQTDQVEKETTRSQSWEQGERNAEQGRKIT